MSMAVEHAKDLKYGPVVARVDSVSEPDKQYEVRENPAGFLSCQCMGWRFNKDRPRHCKHTDAVQGKGTIGIVQPLSAAKPKSVSTIRQEAEHVAREILQYGTAPNAFDLARTKIEAAIRKFLGGVPTPAIVEDVATGVRMITLDE